MVIVSKKDKLEERSKSYLFWKMCFEEGVATEDKLREAVLYRDITPEEFKLIGNIAYD